MLTEIRLIHIGPVIVVEMPLKLFPESAVQAESSDLFLDFIRVH